ncbi:hypothetical protein HY498_05985 [Candidatus Woesearchaeota archaeon]|nr:hypothetical protein [Candidatus Woesearchaeota archaeon]
MKFDDFNENVQERLALLMITAYESKLNQGLLKSINFVKENKREIFDYLNGGINLGIAQFILLYPNKYNFLAPITNYNHQNYNMLLALPFLVGGGFHFFKAVRSMMKNLEGKDLENNVLEKNPVDQNNYWHSMFKV